MPAHLRRRRAGLDIQRISAFILRQPDLRHTIQQVLQELAPHVHRKTSGQTSREYQAWVYRVQAARDELTTTRGYSFAARRLSRTIEYSVQADPGHKP